MPSTPSSRRTWLPAASTTPTRMFPASSFSWINRICAPVVPVVSTPHFAGWMDIHPIHSDEKWISISIWLRAPFLSVAIGWRFLPGGGSRPASPPRSVVERLHHLAPAEHERVGHLPQPGPVPARAAGAGAFGAAAVAHLALQPGVSAPHTAIRRQLTPAL